MTQAFSYDGYAAQTCARLSELVYAPPLQIRAQVAAIVDDAQAQVTLRTLHHRNFRVLVVSTIDAIYVVFRGTVFNSASSWKANLDVGKRNWMNGKVHQGFLGLLENANPVFKPILANINNREKVLYFTGHSQGGAVAFLATVDNTRPLATPRDAQNYTFGQPRSGNKQFCRNAETRLAGNCSRIANKRDLVVGVPLVMQGYDHVRDFLHYDATGAVVRRNQPAGAGWPFLSGSIADHAMLKYRESAEHNVSTSP